MRFLALLPCRGCVYTGLEFVYETDCSALSVHFLAYRGVAV